MGQNFLDFFNASGKNRASLSIIPLSLTGVHTKDGYDVNKILNSQNSKLSTGFIFKLLIIDRSLLLGQRKFLFRSRR